MDTIQTSDLIKNIDPSIITALIGLLGTAVGGLISYFATAFSRKAEWNRELQERRLLRKEELLCAFIAEADRLILKSVTEKTKTGEEFALISSLQSKISLLSCELGEIAGEIFSCAMEAHNSPKKENNSKTENDKNEDESRSEDKPYPKLRTRFIKKCRTIIEN